MGVDLAVVGGGIVGAVAAHRAARLGASVVLFDAADDGRATDAGAGIVSWALNTRDAAPLVDLAAAGCALYPRLLAEFGADLAATPDLDDRLDRAHHRAGLLAPLFEGSDQSAFADRWAVAQARAASGGPRVALLDGSDIDSHHPLLGPAEAALFDPDASRVDGGLVAALAREAAVALGVDVRAERVESVAAARAQADHVLIAGGAWSPSFAEELGVVVPIAPQRGQIAHLRLLGDDGRPVDTGGWPLLSLPADQYQVAWPDGRVAVGATRETGSGFRPVTTVAGVSHVLEHAVRAVPALADAELTEVRVGLRPLSADGHPVIGSLHGHPRVAVVTGHGPVGLTTGPVSARLAVDRLLGADPDPQAVAIDPAPFDPVRFA